MEVGARSVNLQVAPVAARVTSKRLMRPNERLDSLRKFTMPRDRLVAMHEKFPVDLGHKQL